MSSCQSCCSVERIDVYEKIHDAFVAAFVESVKGNLAGWHSLCISSCVQVGMFQSGAYVFSSRSGR